MTISKPVQTAVAALALLVIGILIGWSLNTIYRCCPEKIDADSESEVHLKISSFNIQIFGVAKFDKDDVVYNLIRIIKRYDIVLVQEIRDSSETVIYKFVERLNEDLPSSERYDVVVSDRLGRSSSKEQYAYIYKPTKVEVKDSYVYNDTNGDVFEREPYVVWFRPTSTSIPDFVMIGIHIKPDDAINELNYLPMVYDDVLDRYSDLKDVLLAGDWNADCSYVGTTEWDQVTFRSDDRFLWLLDDDIDSTVAKSSCAYDRFAITGEGMHRAYVPNSASVFYFDEAYGLDEELTKDISDHYPIELILKPISDKNAEERGEL